MHTVAHDRDGVELEYLRNVVDVVLDLIERLVDGRRVGIRIFQLEEHERQPVHIHEDVRPPVVIAPNAKLIDHKELVRSGVLPVDAVDVSMLDAPAGMLDANLEAAREELMEREVPAQRVTPSG
jgi:hypothetical protein